MERRCNFSAFDEEGTDRVGIFLHLWIFLADFPVDLTAFCVVTIASFLDS
jgi:hypothetical protein